MLSVITTLKNRADLLYYGLSSIIRQTAFHNILSKIEINIGDGGSSDNIDDVLESISYHNRVVINKWVIDRNRSSYKHILNCPAEEYNILVKLSKYDYILKIDPEFVLINRNFLSKALSVLGQHPNYIVMPFPYHCYEFPFDNLEDIDNNFKNYVYRTHITRDNARTRNIYYGAIFKKDAFIKLGGIDERFVERGVGFEDDHFLQQWRRRYGDDSTFTLYEHEGVHLWHGGVTTNPVSPNIKTLIEANVNLGKQLANTYPNTNLKWGRLYKHIKLTTWKEGRKI